MGFLEGISNFIVLSQLGFAFFGSANCWFNEELVNLVDLMPEEAECIAAVDDVTAIPQLCYSKFWVISIVMVWTRFAGLACCVYCCMCCMCFMCCAACGASAAHKDAEAEGRVNADFDAKEFFHRQGGKYDMWTMIRLSKIMKK